MVSRLSKSRKAIKQAKIENDDSEGDLLDLLLGNDAEKEEDELDIPSMIMLD